LHVGNEGQYGEGDGLESGTDHKHHERIWSVRWL
jgi:hypothetical protein